MYPGILIGDPVYGFYETLHHTTGQWNEHDQ